MCHNCFPNHMLWREEQQREMTLLLKDSAEGQACWAVMQVVRVLKRGDGVPVSD